MFLCPGEDLRHEVHAARPEQPRQPDDVEARREIAHDLLACRLAARIHADGRGRVPFVIRFAPVAVKHLVGAHVKHRRARPAGARRHVLRTQHVDAKRRVRVGLAGIHVGEGRGMKDEIGLEIRDAGAHARIGDIVTGQIQRQGVMSRKRCLQLPAQLSVMTGDHHAHTAISHFRCQGCSKSFCNFRRIRARLASSASAGSAYTSGTKRTSASRVLPSSSPRFSINQRR